MRGIVLIAFICQALGVYSQEYQLRLFDKRDGMPVSVVFSMAVDDDGYLWTGGTRGVSQFDGNTFQTFGREHGLPSNTVYSVGADGEGNIWAGTEDGVFNLSNKEEYEIDAHDEFSNYIECHYSNNNLLLLGTKNGLFEKRDSVFIARGFEGEYVTGLFGDGERIYVGTENGLSEIIQEDTLIHSQIIRAAAFEASEEDGIYVGANGGLYLLSNGQTYHYEPPFGSGITGLEYYDEKLFVATYGDGLWWFEDGELFEVEGVEEKFSRVISDLIVTDDGLWIASNAGITLLKKSEIKKVSAWDDVHGSFPILKSNSGLYACGSNGAYRLESDTAIHHFLSESERDRFILCQGKTHEGALQLGGIGGVIFEWDGEGLIEVHSDILDEIRGELFIYDIASNDSITYYAASTSVITYNGAKYGFVVPDSIGEMTYSILCNDDGVWFASGNGLTHFDGESYHKYNQSSGMPTHFCMQITDDKWGNIWMGTASDGLIRFDGKAFEHIYKGLSDEQIKALKWDEGRECLWVGTNEGLNRVEFSESGELNGIEVFSPSTGYNILYCHNKGIEVLKDGRVIFAADTKDGDNIFEYQEQGETNTLNTPNTLITSTSVFNKDTAFTTLTYKENYIGFEFTSVHLTRGKYAEFQWKLEGVESEWQHTSKLREVKYSNLIPGEYLFSVRSRVPQGEWSEVAEVGFIITPPFWATWWFYILSAILVVGSLYIIAKKRVERKLGKQREDLNQMRKRAELELKAARAQLNPHFLFNVLNSIQDLLLDEDEESARIYLSDFSHLMREVLDRSSKPLVTLDEELELLRLYLKLEKLRFGEGLEVVFDVDDNLLSRLIPSLILQPYVENAIKHGIQNQGTIKIQVFEANGLLKCIIEDNGVGFNDNDNDLKPASKGLRMMQDRLEALNQMNNTGSYKQDIIHLEKGTRVELTLKSLQDD